MPLRGIMNDGMTCVQKLDEWYNIDFRKTKITFKPNKEKKNVYFLFEI